MSTLSVTTINTANGTTDLTLKSGNTSGATLVVGAGSNISITNTTNVLLGSNVNISTSSITLGNSTVNGSISSSSIRVGNSTAAFTTNSTGIYHTGSINSTSINSTSLSTGSISVNTTGLYVSNIASNGTAYISNGFFITPGNWGVINSNITMNSANGNYQYLTVNGAFTWTAPTTDCAIDILITNGASAGSITFSGFTVDTNNAGDVYSTTNGKRFLVMVRRINGVSTYIIKALQA